MLKELEITGKPGNIVAVYNMDPDYENLPTHGLAWGPFDENGVFKLIVDSDQYPDVMIREYEPHVAEFFKRWWHINTA